MDDEYWLRQAIALARHCPQSSTAFSVGAVVVQDDRVLATGYSRRDSPHDHAEEAALRDLEPPLPAATIYSSLEPCGERASRPVTCAELIIAAGIRRVVFAWREPDTFVAAQGTRVLRDAGVTVVELSQLASLAAEVNSHLT